MRMKKKMLAYGVMVALSVSMLVGCGSKKESEKAGRKVDKSITEVAENVVKSVEDIDSMKLGIKGSVDIDTETDGVNAVIKGGAELNGVFTIDIPAFNLDGSLFYEIGAEGQKLSGEYTANAYGETEDDTMNVYAKTNITDWVMESVDVSEYIESVSMIKSQVNELADMIGELDEKEIEDAIGDYLTLEEKTKSVNGKECYVLSADLDMNDIAGLNEYTGEELDDFMESVDSMNLSYGVCIDTKTFIPVKFYMNLSAKGNEEDTKISINDMSFEFNFVANSGKVESVPKDAKEKAESIEDMESDDMSFGSMFDSGDVLDFDEGQDEDADDDEFHTVDTKYIPKSFTLEGKKYNVGDKAGILLGDGYEIDKSRVDFETIDSYESERIYLISPKNEDNGFSITVYNDTDSEIEIKDASLTGITIENDSELSLSLDNDIKLGGDPETIKEVYKGQKESYSFDGEYSASVEYQDEDYNRVDFYYDKESNIITEIDFIRFDE